MPPAAAAHSPAGAQPEPWPASPLALATSGHQLAAERSTQAAGAGGAGGQAGATGNGPAATLMIVAA